MLYYFLFIFLFLLCYLINNGWFLLSKFWHLAHPLTTPRILPEHINSWFISVLCTRVTNKVNPIIWNRLLIGTVTDVNKKFFLYFIYLLWNSITWRYSIVCFKNRCSVRYISRSCCIIRGRRSIILLLNYGIFGRGSGYFNRYSTLYINQFNNFTMHVNISKMVLDFFTEIYLEIKKTWVRKTIKQWLSKAAWY